MNDNKNIKRFLEIICSIGKTEKELISAQARIKELETEVEKLKKFENTILSKDHTKRYTLGGVTGLEEQIKSLKNVCHEHSSEMIFLQSNEKKSKELLQLALEAMKKRGICGECKHYSANHMQGLCADCINDTAQSPCKLEYLSNHWTWKHKDEKENKYEHC